MSRFVDVDPTTFADAGATLLGHLMLPVVHDLNNLLTAMTTLAEVAAEGLPEDSVARADFVQLLRYAEGAAELTRRLKAVGTPSAGASCIDAGEVVRDTQRLIACVLGKDTVVDVDAPPVARAVRVDRTELERVILNLAANARDAMRDGGRFSLTVEERLIEDRPGLAPGRYAAIVAADTGAGIPAETLGRVFEESFTTKKNGRGVGLASSRSLIRDAGGDIEVVSGGAGAGTTFTVLLPLAP